MVHRVLVGVDGSEPSRAALAWSVRRARALGVPLVLAHVVDPSDPASSADEALAERELAALAETDVCASAVTLEGSLAWALGHVATADDWVVVGTHKTGFLHGRVLGSRAVQVALAVPTSVAVIPEIDLRFRRGVLAGIDRAETAAAIALVAGAEAEERGEELTLLESVPSADARREDLPISLAVDAARARYPGLTIRSRVSTRGPAEALLDAARDKALLVLGPGSVDSTRSPIGSVVHDVLLNVTAPVLVARPLECRIGSPAAAEVRAAVPVGSDVR